MTDEAKALAELQRAAGLKDLPTPLTHDLRIAVSGEGPRAYDWQDKPHRLLYDACAEIETQAREIERLREALQSVVNACDQGKLAPLGGPCGMTIEAQIRGSVYNRVPAWPVEEARAALAGDSHDQ